MKRLMIAAVAALACLSAPAMAQDAPGYIWINSMKAMPGQGDALIKLIIEESAKSYDPLVESGAAHAWGLAMPVVHDGDDAASHIEWIVFNGWAGADAFMKNFMESRRSMSAETMAAQEAKWEGVVVPGSHSDLIVRGIHTGSGKPARPGYIHVGYYQSRPGKFEDTNKLYKELAAPVYDKLVADGTILNYGLDTPEVNRGQKWTHMTWYASKDLATRDVVRKAFDAATAARTKEQNEAFGKRFNESLDSAGRSDQILMVVHYKMKSAE